MELPRVALVTTQGFADVIEIGRQNRSELYNLFVRRPTPIVDRADRIGVRERIDQHGDVVIALQEHEIERVVTELRGRNVAAVAIGFLHAYANPAHERRVAQALRAAFPSIAISCSSEIDPQYREYERFSTTVVNAALQPIVERYVRDLERELHNRKIGVPLFLMQSNGGMAASSRIAQRPAAMIQSGPAAGVVAAADLARAKGFTHAISFDMGGTTAKAAAIANGRVQLATEFEATGFSHGGRQTKGSGYPVRFPFVDLAEVGAGGGTIARAEQGTLYVGPISAGADPGPACYGKSDAATVTDADVVLGRLPQDALAGGSFAIDAARSFRAIEKLATAVGLSTHAAAAGIVSIVDAQMARVTRTVTVERGLDPRDYILIAFGGNGPLHACALAEELGMRRIAVPRSPGVFSARGLLAARSEVALLRSILGRADHANAQALQNVFRDLESDARRTLLAEGADEANIRITRTYDARYAGQSFELQVKYADALPEVVRGFHLAHRRRFGYSSEQEPVELVNARLLAADSAVSIAPASRDGVPSPSASSRPMWENGRYVDAPVFDRASLATDVRIDGPAAIEEYDACTYLAHGWTARADDDLLVLTHDA